MNIRWMIRRDLPEVLAIAHAHNIPWDEAEIRGYLRKQNCIALVAEEGERIAGFTLYELRRRSLEVIALCVHPGFLGQQIGRGLIDRLKYKVQCTPHRQEIALTVHERNVAAQKFLRRMGFLAAGFLHNEYENGDGAIRFLWVVGDRGPVMVIERDIA